MSLYDLDEINFNLEDALKEIDEIIDSSEEKCKCNSNSNCQCSKNKKEEIKLNVKNSFSAHSLRLKKSLNEIAETILTEIFEMIRIQSFQEKRSVCIDIKEKFFEEFRNTSVSEKEKIINLITLYLKMKDFYHISHFSFKNNQFSQCILEIFW